MIRVIFTIATDRAAQMIDDYDGATEDGELANFTPFANHNDSISIYRFQRPALKTATANQSTIPH